MTKLVITFLAFLGVIVTTSLAENVASSEEIEMNEVIKRYPISLQSFGVDEAGKVANAVAKIKDGFSKGQELFTQLKKSNFVESVTKASKWAGPLFTSLGFFAKVIGGFINPDSKELIFMKEQFKILNNKMDSLENEFGEVKRLIDWTSVKVSYGEYERSINVMRGHLYDVVDAPMGPVKDMMRNNYIMLYERTFNEASKKLYDGIVNDQMIFSENLIVAARKYSKDHQRKVQKFLIGILQLILKGAELEMAYMAFKSLDSGIEFWSGVWEKRIESLEGRFLKTDSEIEARWHAQAELDVEEFNAVNHAKSNEHYSSDLYNFLQDKFQHRQWFVLIYNPISGGDKHYVFACGGFIKFRARGKNVVIGSASADHSRTGFNSNEALNILKSIPTRQYLGGNRAERLLNDMISKTGNMDCRKYSMGAVVGWGEGVWYVAPPSRRAYNKFEGLYTAGRNFMRITYNTLLFG